MTRRTVIIGGGFYGLSVALFLRDELGLKDITVIDKEDALMTRASYVNQARVHNGYHYPRSILTAARSAANFPRFVAEYEEAIVSDFDKYYAISMILSKVNARQFVNFSKKIGAKIEPADQQISSFFNPKLVEGVYKVQEYAFNSHALRDLLIRRISEKPGISVRTGEEVENISEATSGIDIRTNKADYHADYVINTTYAQMNVLHRRSGLPLLPLKHEVAEMALVQLPLGMENFSITVMDGPFFSIMPFPSRNLHTLSHVRYTPHSSWVDDDDTEDDKKNPHAYLSKNKPLTNFKKMHADVVRYIPAMKDMKYVESISDIKTILIKSENDDSRPILFRAHFGIKGYACIMGGKLDNIYDVFDEVGKFYE